MVCEKCGTNLNEEDKYCSNCGYNLTRYKEPIMKVLFDDERSEARFVGHSPFLYLFIMFIINLWKNKLGKIIIIAIVALALNAFLQNNQRREDERKLRAIDKTITAVEREEIQ